MSGVSLSKGWWIFAKALFQSKPWSVSNAAEWVFRLNVTARNLRRHPIKDQIYEIKNAMIKYLYLHGYCIEVKQHTQKRICHSCGGDGVYWNGEECWKCDGTGIYDVVPLYAFRFNVIGKHYAWHQLRKLVDYPIVLTDAEPGPFVEPTPKEELSLKLEDAWLGCAIVYWFLFFHGTHVSLLLFNQTRLRILWGWRMRISPIKQWLSRWHFSMKQGNDHQLVEVPEDDIPF